MRKVIWKITSIIGIVWLSLGCNNDEITVPEPGKTQLVDLGELPAKVEVAYGFKPAVATSEKVVIATNDGVWEFNTTTSKWARLGLDGKEVTLVYAHPQDANLLFAGINTNVHEGGKSLFRSEDAGKTWIAVETPIYNIWDEKYEIYFDLVVRPNFPNHIYANMSGTTIAISTDKGKNWKRTNDKEDSNFGYQSNLVFLPGQPNKIYQGSENPLDFAWLGEYEIDASSPSKLGEAKLLVNIDTWSNRRPVELITNTFTGNAIYVGQEGALSKVVNGQSSYIFKVDDEEELSAEKAKFPYAYIYGVWVNPQNTNHLLFGGGINGKQETLSLFETVDEGKNIVQFDTKLGMTEPFIHKILHTGSGPLILVSDLSTNKVKLFKYNLK